MTVGKVIGGEVRDGGVDELVLTKSATVNDVGDDVGCEVRK